MKAFLAEFKEFINKGNLLGIAVGFVMGVAVAAVVTALVDNIIMPIVAIPFGEPNFDSALIITANDSQIKIGAFITAVVTFIAIAITVFLILKAYNRAARPEAAAPPADVVALNGILAEMQGLRSDLSAGGGASPPVPPAT